MPNWVFNSLVIEGEASKIAEVKAQLAQPFEEKHYNFIDGTHKTEIRNEPLSFWNIIKPTDLEAYYDAKDKPQTSEDHWYNWNIRNWGVKWDASDVYFVEESEEPTSLCYNFSTPWGVPNEAMLTLSEQYPTLTFELEFEEEQGWGGTIVYTNGCEETTEEYNDKCRQCGALDVMDYCDECECNVCAKCNYAEFAPEEMCETHKEKETVNG